MKLGWRGFVEVAHMAVLGLWLGVVLTVGMFAGIVFPMMHRLDPRLPAFESFDGPHWTIAAGQVANQGFAIAAFAQLGCGFAALLSYVLVAKWLMRRVPAVCVLARQLTLLFVVGCLIYNFVALRPRMRDNVEAFWKAAEAGRNEEAKKYQAAFDADHPVATRVFGMTAAGLVLCVGAAGWSWARMRDGADGKGEVQ